MFILVSRRNTTAIGWEMLGLFPGTAISSLRCQPRPLPVPREIGVHAAERALLPNTRHRSSVRPPGRRRTFQRTNWGTEQLSEDLRSCSKMMATSSPEKPHPHVKHRDSQRLLTEWIPAISLVLCAHRCWARGERGPEFPRWEAGLSPCGAVGL